MSCATRFQSFHLLLAYLAIFGKSFRSLLDMNWVVEGVHKLALFIRVCG